MKYILLLALVFILSNSFEGYTQEIFQLIKANHNLYVPRGKGPFPVIIAFPGCSGVSLHGPETDVGRPNNEDDVLFRRHYPKMAKNLQKEGYLVLLVDYLSAENVINTCSGEIPHERVSEYIKGSLDFLKTILKADSSRITVLGFSYGGVGTLIWLSNLEYNPPGVQSVIVIYPGCATSKGWKSSLPVLMLLGELDDIAPPNQCLDLVNSLPKETNVRIKTYPNARHGFDMAEGPELLSIGHGLTVGRNEQAGKEAWKDIFLFLGKYMKRQNH